MIVVFVVDTSPSMGQHLAPSPNGSNTNGSVSVSTSPCGSMSKLDLAKMAVESLTKSMKRRVSEHNVQFQQESSPLMQQALHNLGLGYCRSDQFLLLSTTEQHQHQKQGSSTTSTAACAGGGRLLVGYGDSMDYFGSPSADPHSSNQGTPLQTASSSAGFDRALKHLQASSTSDNEGPDRPAAAADATAGLNVAINCAIRLMSRHRLQTRLTENFGMGRLPSNVMPNSSGKGVSTHALMPACLVLLTDGLGLQSNESSSSTKNGTANLSSASLQLQFGNNPLEKFYQEPFRWDQRVYCVNVGNTNAMGSNKTPDNDLTRLCQVTGGCYMTLTSPSGLSKTVNTLLNMIAPPRPRELPILYPLARNNATTTISKRETSSSPAKGRFVNGGPICCFQSLQGAIGPGPLGVEAAPTKRAMLLYVPYQQQPLAQGVAEHGATITASTTTQQQQLLPWSPPLWCIPESYFSSKKLDMLPPRLAEPLLRFSTVGGAGNAGGFANSTSSLMMGSNSTFDPERVMALLQRFDQLTAANHACRATTIQPTANAAQIINPATKLLHRDVYICDWLSVTLESDNDAHHGHYGVLPPTGSGASIPRSGTMEFFPVSVQGAGRPLADGDDHSLNIGILHIPPNVMSLSKQQHSSSSTSALNGESSFSTLTLLPPDPHILLPLLIRAAEAEQRLLKKKLAMDNSAASKPAALQQVAHQKLVVPLDEHWRNDFRAYLFRIPPYYHNALKRSLRPVLPTSAHSLLTLDGNESLASQCFSKACLQMIRNGEQIARDTNERLERQEAELRRRGVSSSPTALSPSDSLGQSNKPSPNINARPGNAESSKATTPAVGYGQYDPRDSTTSYLAALRTLPAPWKVKNMTPGKERQEPTTHVVESSSQEGRARGTASTVSSKVAEGGVKTVVEVLGEHLPNDCLLPYYESRRRWLFGGTGLTTRGLHVEGVDNDGSNVHHYDANHSLEDEPLIALAGVGASTLNQTPTSKMGDFRERLLWSRAPVVGYGSNGATGVSATTGPDGAPTWSVDDDAMPMSFFDSKSGEFVDSVQTRVSARVLVNFGNPFKDKRGDSIIPEAFLNQSPSSQRSGDDSSVDEGPHTPPGSPPHDAFSEGEDEAVFVAERPQPRRPHGRHQVVAEMSKGRDDSLNPDGKRMHKEIERNTSSHGNTLDVDDIALAGQRKKPKISLEPPPPQQLSSNRSQRLPPPPPPKPPQRKKPQPPPRPPTEKHLAVRPPAPPLTRKEPTSVSTEATASVRKWTNSDKDVVLSGSAQEHQKQQQQQQQQTLPPLDFASPDRKPQVELPPGWMVVWSKSQKRWYFFDTKTNKSVWQWPPAGGG